MKKQLPNLISLLRVIGALIMLVVKPFGIAFYIIYAICGFSDLADGMLARQLRVDSKAGQLIDSLADFIFIVIMIIIVLNQRMLPLWAQIWIALIAAIRAASLATGLARFKQIALIHTYANKVTGFLLFLFPLMYAIIDINAASAICCGVATLSSIEELAINISSKELDRNRTTIFIR